MKGKRGAVDDPNYCSWENWNMKTQEGIQRVRFRD